jgi:hypothetical protein
MGGFAIDVGVALTLARPEVLGIRGAAIAQALTLSFSAIARLLLVRRFLGIWPFDAAYLRLIVPTLAGALGMFLGDALIPDRKWLVDLVGSFALGGVAYVATLLALGLKPTERRAALRMAGKVLRRPAAAA